MKIFVATVLAALCICAAELTMAAPAAPAIVSSETAKSYLLGVGDIIRVEVHDEPDLTLETQLPALGTIDYPFLGNVRAVGLTVDQLQTRVAQGLRGDYLVKPEVRVRVVTYRPFFVRGQVKNSGGYPYVLGLTVEKAATMAGGFTDRASLKNIFLIREHSTQGQKIKVGLDSGIAPGDTIIVEESLF